MPTKDFAAYDAVSSPALTDEHMIRDAGGTTYNKTTQQIVNNIADTDAKTTLVAADPIVMVDSEASDVVKRITFANLLVQIFSNLTGKTTPVDADEFTIADSAASSAGKNLTWANLKATLISSLGALITGSSAKTTPIDADDIVICDSADSDATKKVTWSNVKATLKSYFDTLYAAVGSPYTAATMGDFIVGLSGKTTPVDGDSVLASDSADSDDAKKVTWANVKATLKTYFDTLYVGIDGGSAFHTKIIEIGDWNMDADASVSIAHGVTRDNIRNIFILIRNDTDTYRSPIFYQGDGYFRLTATLNVEISRVASGTFDNSNYDSTSYNRGWIIITYV